jgi:hypothetical protein
MRSVPRCYRQVKYKVFFFCIVGGGVQTGSTRHVGHLLAYCTCPGWSWGWRIIRWNEDWQGKPKYSEKTCTGATLSTTNPTWPDPGLNTGRRGGKPATNRFSYGAASLKFSVEAGSNTSTVALRVVGGDEKGSLESKTVKYGRESHGTRSRELLLWRAPAAIINDRPVLSSVRASHINKPATIWQ